MSARSGPLWLSVRGSVISVQGIAELSWDAPEMSNFSNWVPPMLISIISLSMTLMLCVPVHRWLGHRAVLDRPTARSSHSRPTLRGGGLAPAVGIALVGAGAAAVGYRYSVAVVVCAVSYAILGFVEDLFGMAAMVRLGIQMILAVASNAIVIFVVGHPDNLIVAIGASTIWLTGCVNMVNFMDGVNGISSLHVVLSGGYWIGLGITYDLDWFAVCGALGLGAALGFLPFNFPAAKMFLGDTGSYLFGSWMGIMGIVGSVAGVPMLLVIAPSLVYLIDTSTTLLGRILHGKNLMTPHREHTYQRLAAMGWPHWAVATYVVLNSAVVSALVVLGVQGRGGTALMAYLGVVGVTAMYLLSPAAISVCRDRR